MDQKKFAAGEILFSEGDAGDTAFLVAQGAVQVTREINGKETVLGEIGPGQILGEMALINNQPRMATAKAKEDTVCVFVPVGVFESELGNMNAFMKALMLNLIGRLRTAADKMDEVPEDEDELEFAEDDDEEVTFFTPGEDGKYHGGN